MTALAIGRIVTAHGRHYTVEVPDRSRIKCFPKGKKSDAAVGDRVEFSHQGPGEGRLERILPRSNLLYRSDDMRSKQFAANVDQLLIVVAVAPKFSDDLTGRALAGAWSAGITPIIVLNKVDLDDGVALARQRLAGLAALGVIIVETSARDEAATRAALLPHLAGKTNLLLGQSGMGKSTLLNALVPGAAAATREHSVALDMGKHTTTSTQLYHLPESGDLIDSPGFQAFGLQHLGIDDIVAGFPEFRPGLAACRFYNCRHLHEPGCGVRALIDAGRIDPDRYALYMRLVAENDAGRDRY